MDEPFHAKTNFTASPSDALRRFYHSTFYTGFTVFQLLLTLGLISLVLVDLGTHQRHRWTAIITIESVVLCFFLSDVLVRILVFKCYALKNFWFLTDLAVFCFLIVSSVLVYSQGYFKIPEKFDLLLLFTRVG